MSFSPPNLLRRASSSYNSALFWDLRVYLFFNKLSCLLSLVLHGHPCHWAPLHFCASGVPQSLWWGPQPCSADVLTGYSISADTPLPPNSAREARPPFTDPTDPTGIRSLGGSRSRVSSPAAAVICAHIVFCPSSILPRLRSSFQERNGWGGGTVRGGRSFSSHHLGSCYVRSLPLSSKNIDVCEQRSLTSLIKMRLRSDLLC